MHRSLCCLAYVLFGSLLVVETASAQPPAAGATARSTAVAPYLDDQTLAIGRLDLQRLDVAEVVKFVQQLAPQPEPEFQKQLAMAQGAATEVLTTFKDAGISELYLVISLADVPQYTPFVVAPVAAGQSAADAATKISDVLPRPQNQTIEAVGQGVVIGHRLVVERLRKLEPSPRPELVRAFALAGDTTAQFIFSPTADTRRVLREMLPRLPDEVGGGSGRMLADGVQWAVASFNAPPELSLRLTIQSKDADSAAAVRGMAISALDLLRRHDEIREEVPEIDAIARLLTPQLQNDQLVINLSDDNGGTAEVVKLLARPVQAARESARRMQSSNNLKQIALALHNYHDTYGHFPPQAIRDKEGKALLSWRVAILPFIDQSVLYEQFRLDEPWDSEHNRKLAQTLPAVYVSPSLRDADKAKGLTTYLAPISRTPPERFVPPAEGAAAEKRKEDDRRMVFDNPAGTSFRDIIDGTSNTIGVVQVHPDHAVIWTKPDDVVIDNDDPLAALRGQTNEGFNAMLCDGSVKFILESIDPQLLRLLLWRNDRQPVGQY